MLELCTCKRCGWQWYSRAEKLPKACPKCKSYAWQKERKAKKGVEK